VSYQLTEAEQSIWDKLLCLAGLCGNDGIIADHDLRPYPREFVIHELHADPEVFETTMQKCIDEGRITEDGQGIRITNWNKYQSEYDRQKQYRDKRDPHLYVGPGRAEQIKASVEAVNTEEHMKAWEDAHPGKTHPARELQKRTEV